MRLRLQVRNPEKYTWEPKKLLGQLSDLYLHLDCDQLAQCIANDERSYNDQLFDIAIQRMVKANIKTTAELERFSRLKARIDAIVAQRRQDDDDLGDVPDEFMGKVVCPTSVQHVHAHIHHK